jgi:glycopeptide antibiotics resistance protein
MRDLNERLKLHQYVGLLVLIAGLLIILYLTLRPFTFQFHPFTISNYIAGYDILPSSFADFPHNILLFTPFGFGMAAVLNHSGCSGRCIRITVLSSGFLLTLSVESLQHFINGRQPSVADLIANTLGALAGLACFHLWQNRKMTADWIREFLRVPRRALVGLAIYVLLLLLLALGLSFATDPYNWNENYMMMLGNERTGDRQWLGSVQNLVILNRALKGAEARRLLTNPAESALMIDEGLLAYYPLTGYSIEPDLTGNQPDLIWQSADKIETEKGVVKFDRESWLETESPVKDLTERLQEASGISVRLSVATAQLEQKGPARILSISEDPHLRNLTFGQEGKDLVVRYRSILTGRNGTQPQIVFPDFFVNSEPIDLLITFNGLTMDLINSRLENNQSIELVPGVAFYYGFMHIFLGDEFSDDQAPAVAINDWTYRLLFYSFVLLPFGIFLSLRSITTWPWKYRLILVILSLLVVPVLLEIAFVYGRGLGLRTLNIGVSVLVIVLIAWVFIPIIRWFLGRLETVKQQRSIS